MRSYGLYTQKGTASPLISELLGFPKRVMTMLHLKTVPATMATRNCHSFCSTLKRLISILSRRGGRRGENERGQA